MIRTDIEEEIKVFKKLSNPEDRYTSFDYCYNYFIETEDLTKDIEKSCLVLGFYLASWGMFRGSSFILQKSSKHFEKTIKYINGLDSTVWDIDVDKYSKDNVSTILDIYKEIKDRLVVKNSADLTLVTKVLLGIFGFIPAYDTYFCDTFRTISAGRCGFRSVNSNSLNIIREFYDANKETIDGLSDQTFTTDFVTGMKTNIHYPKAKIIDMYGFNIGLQLSNS